MSFDKNALKPAATFYRDSILGGKNDPHEICVHFFQNLQEPFYFINHFLGGDWEFAFESLFRFFINSGIGFFGFFDIGNEIGLSRRETSHRSTLKKLGVPAGDYLVLPFLGPASVRDAIMEPISWFMNPVNYLVNMPISVLRAILEAIVVRAENGDAVDALLNNSINIYAAMKSMYIQKYGP